MNDDILSVIVTFTTPGVSLDLLASFMPKDAYTKQVWRLKALVESRGLVVNDEVVDFIRTAEERRGDWYAYYLIQNKSYCGDLVAIKTNVSNKLETEYLVDGILFFAAYSLGKTVITVVQYDNLSVRIRSKTYTHINRKIRAVVKDKSPHSNNTILLLIDEYGDVWLYNTGYNSNQGTIEASVPPPRKHQTNTGVVSILPYTDGVFQHANPIYLMRDGIARNGNNGQSLDAPKLVSIYYKDNGSTNAITYNGFSIEIPSTNHRNNGYGSHLNGTLTTKLDSIILWNFDMKYRIVKLYKGVTLMTTNRTALCTKNSPSKFQSIRENEAPITRNRTQNVEIVDGAYGIVYAILDPVK